MITSTSNQQVRTIIQLQKKAKARQKHQLFIVEGLRIFEETPKELIDKIYVSNCFLSEHKDFLDGCKYEVVSDTVFARLADTMNPQGILCAVKMGFLKNKISGKGMTLILENIQDPGNLGTMLRTAEGAGVSGVLMDKNTADIFSPKVIRSTMGSIFRVPFQITDDLQSEMKRLQSKGVCIYAAYPESSRDYTDISYIGDIAFVIGNEGNGLTEQTANTADTRVRIPMGGKLESLNAAVAASVLLYEGRRQLEGRV